MATLVGEQSVRGSTETVRLLLLTFVSIGVTYVDALVAAECQADFGSEALRGGWR